MNSSDYKFRRVYKVDWKVCFLRWSQRNEKVYEYHAFVEDDSFVCVGNLLHQVSLLSSIKPFSPFRTGTPMVSSFSSDGGWNILLKMPSSLTCFSLQTQFDGFDDSSTFMSGEVAEIFAKYYPKDGFNCSVIVDSTDEDRLTKAQWLSWGNSWMSTNCAWRDNMFTSFHFNITEPKINCLQSVFKDKRVNVTALGIAHNPSTYAHSIHYPCQEHPIIFHHGKAGEILLRDKGSDKLRHLCEYMLLVDKIKDPKVMLTLHTEASAHNYRDFTPIFTHDSEEGWVYLLRAFEAEEQACAAVEGPPSPHCQQLRARRLAQNEDTAVRIAGKASQGAQLGFGLGSRAEPPPLREERENTLPAREDPGYRAYFGAVAVALDLDGT